MANSDRTPLICVVDDDHSVRRALARLMQSLGLDVETYASGPEFLGAEHTRQIACLILDVHLGKMSGFELRRQMVTSGIAPPVIFITAHDTESTREQTRSLSAAGYLRKPFEEDSLLDALGRAIGRPLGT